MGFFRRGFFQKNPSAARLLFFECLLLANLTTRAQEKNELPSAKQTKKDLLTVKQAEKDSLAPQQTKNNPPASTQTQQDLAEPNKTKIVYNEAPSGNLVHSSVLPSGLQLEVFRTTEDADTACVQWLPLSESSENSNQEINNAAKKQTAPVKNGEKFITIFATRTGECELNPVDKENIAAYRVGQMQNISGLIGFQIPLIPPETRYLFRGKNLTDEVVLTRLSSEEAQRKIELLSTSVGPKIPPQSIYRYFPGLNFFLASALGPVSITPVSQDLSRSPQLLNTIGGGTNFDFFFYRPLQVQFEIFQSIHRIHAFGDASLPDLYNFTLFGLKHRFEFSKRVFVPKFFIGLNYNQLQLGFPTDPARLTFRAQGLGAEMDLFWPHLALYGSSFSFLRNSALRSETRIALFSKDSTDTLSSNLELRNTYYYRIKRDTLLGISHWMRKINGKNYDYSVNGGLISLRVENLFLETL